MPLREFIGDISLTNGALSTVTSVNYKNIYFIFSNHIKNYVKLPTHIYFFTRFYIMIIFLLVRSKSGDCELILIISFFILIIY